MGRRILVLLAAIVAASAATAGDYDRGLRAAQAGDFETAFAEWMPLAEAGNAAAQYNIARMYRQGDFVDRDDAEAARWYLAAAEQGLVPAQAQIGWMLANGVGVARDLRAAARWTHRAAEGGDAQARQTLVAIQSELGWAYMGGDAGLSQDIGLSCMWFTFAAENGSAEAEQMAESVCGIAAREGEAARIDRVRARCLATGFRECD
jgi:hypothetical protein